MSTKKSEKLHGWDVLALLLMVAVIVSATLCFSSGLFWLWPVTFFLALIVVLSIYGKKDARGEFNGEA